MISSDFIFGQRGRGLLLDDRIAFGQGKSTDPITAKYDALLEYDPVVLLPMNAAAYTEYRGQQLFFQDPAGTTPAVDVGDPAGGGLDLVSGDILATQDSDSRRPILGADALIFSESYLRFPYTDTGGYTAIVALNPDALPADASQRFMSSVNLNRQLRYNSSVPELATTSGSISHGLSVDATSQVLGFAVLDGDSAIYSTQHGVTTDTSVVSDDLDGMDIGRSGSNFFGGTISTAVIFDSRLSDADLEAVCKILEITP